MTVRTFLLGSVVAILISWAVWLLVLFWMNPLTTGTLGFVLFFLTLFLVIASSTALVGYGLRRLVAGSQLPTYSVRYSLRQSVLLGLLVNVNLLLQLTRLLRWWLVLIIIAVFISIEFFFLSYDQSIIRRQRLDD